jgi:hypothetical protein
MTQKQSSFTSKQKQYIRDEVTRLLDRTITMHFERDSSSYVVPQRLSKREIWEKLREPKPDLLDIVLDEMLEDKTLIKHYNSGKGAGGPYFLFSLSSVEDHLLKGLL